MSDDIEYLIKKIMTKHLNMTKSLVCIVLTSYVNDNIDSVLEQLTGKWFDLDSSSRTWSTVLLNKQESTIIALQKIVDKIPNCSSNVFELIHFCDTWSDEQITNEVFKVLPRSVMQNKLYIMINEHTIFKEIYQANKSIKYVYGLWDSTNSMPSFMKQLKKDTEEKCSLMRTDLLNKEDIMKIMDRDVWDMLNMKIRRKVVLADISRYYLMWREGGFYLDLDVRVNQNLSDIVISSLKNNENIILFTEHDDCNPMYMGKRENKNYRHRIYNCMFWSREKNEFWKECIDLTIKRCKMLIAENSEITDEDVIWVSGPDVITTVYNQNYRDDTGIRVYDGVKSREILTHLNGGTWRNEQDSKN